MAMRQMRARRQAFGLDHSPKNMTTTAVQDEIRRNTALIALKAEIEARPDDYTVQVLKTILENTNPKVIIVPVFNYEGVLDVMRNVATKIDAYYYKATPRQLHNNSNELNCLGHVIQFARVSPGHTPAGGGNKIVIQRQHVRELLKKKR